MTTARLLGIFLLIHFSICINYSQAFTHFMTPFDVKDTNIESTVIPADINVPEAEEQMPSNNQKPLPGRGIRHEKRKRRYDLYEENLSDTKKDNVPAPGSLGKYFVYVNCTECKVKSELLVKSKNTKESTKNSNSRIRTTKKGLKLHHNKNLRQEGETRLEHDEDQEQEQETYQNEEMSMDKKEPPLYYFTYESFEDGEVYNVTDIEFSDTEPSKNASIENTTEKLTTGSETTEEKTATEETSGVSTTKEKPTKLKTTEIETTSAKTTE